MRSLVPLALAALAAQAVQTPKAPLPRGAEALDFMEVVWDMDSNGDLVPTIRVTGANVQIVNGTGESIGYGGNGRGNLILGYNESDGSESRSGSHNLVIGPGHSYWGSASIVQGSKNGVDGDGSAAIGGSGNFVGDEGAVAVGGAGNAVLADHSVIVAGQGNRTEILFGRGAALVAGKGNGTWGGWSAIVGGQGNGIDQNAKHSTITGGGSNWIGHDTWNASISGGKGRFIPPSAAGGPDFDWAAGSLYEDD